MKTYVKKFFSDSTRIKLKMLLRLTISTIHCAVQSLLILLIMARGGVGNPFLGNSEALYKFIVFTF